MVDKRDIGSFSEALGEPRWCIRLLVRHPSMPLEEVSRVLGIHESNKRVRVFDTIVKSDSTKPTEARRAVWSYSIKKAGSQYFAEELHNLIESLRKGEPLFQKIRDTGGEATIIVEFPGDQNVGDVIGASDIGVLARLGINLGLEVYPI